MITNEELFVHLWEEGLKQKINLNNIQMYKKVHIERHLLQNVLPDLLNWEEKVHRQELVEIVQNSKRWLTDNYLRVLVLG
jgi:hypothetical protein